MVWWLFFFRDVYGLLFVGQSSLDVPPNKCMKNRNIFLG